MHISPINRWRLVTFAIIAAMWAAVLAVYLTIAQLNGGVTALIEKVYGDNPAAITLLILFVIVVLFGWWIHWLAANDHDTPIGWAVGGATTLLIALIVGSQWVTWAWPILWTIPLATPLLLGSAATLWLIEARPRPDDDEDEGEDDLVV